MPIEKIVVEAHTFETIPPGGFVAALQVIGNQSGTLADEVRKFGGAPGEFVSASVTLSQPVNINEFDENSFIIYMDGGGFEIRWRPQDLAVYGVDENNDRHLLCNVTPWPDDAPWIGTAPDSSPSCTLGHYSI